MEEEEEEGVGEVEGEAEAEDVGEVSEEPGDKLSGDRVRGEEEAEMTRFACSVQCECDTVCRCFARYGISSSVVCWMFYAHSIRKELTRSGVQTGGVNDEVGDANVCICVEEDDEGKGGARAGAGEEVEGRGCSVLGEMRVGGVIECKRCDIPERAVGSDGGCCCGGGG